MIGGHARDHCERRAAATLCRQRGLPHWRESCARRALSGFHALTFFRLPAPFARQCSCRRAMVVARPDTRRTDERRVRARCALVIGVHIPQPPHALTRRAGSVEASNWSARSSITDLLGANSVGQARVELWSGSRVRCRPAPKLPRSNAFTLEGEGQDSIRRAYGTPRQAGGAGSGKAYEWARLSQGGACGGRPARKLGSENADSVQGWKNSFWRAGENKRCSGRSSNLRVGRRDPLVQRAARSRERRNMTASAQAQVQLWHRSRPA